MRFAVLLLALVGCAKNPNIVDAPAWQTADGAKSVKLELAEWMVESGNTSSALELIATLRDQGIDEASLDLLQGKALLKENTWGSAEDALARALARMPRNPDVYRAMGLLYAETERYESAEQAWSRALSLSPEDAKTWNNLGYLKMVNGDCSGAETDLREAISQDATESRYRNNLAFALVCKGDGMEAVELFRSTLSETDARTNMGIAYERFGTEDEALVHYRAALLADPDNERAREALDRINAQEKP